MFIEDLERVQLCTRHLRALSYLRTWAQSSFRNVAGCAHSALALASLGSPGWTCSRWSLGVSPVRPELVHTGRGTDALPLSRWFPTSAGGNRRTDVVVGMVQKGPPKDVVFSVGLEGCMGEEGEELFRLWEPKRNGRCECFDILEKL